MALISSRLLARGSASSLTKTRCELGRSLRRSFNVSSPAATGSAVTGAKEPKKWSTELAKELAEAIEVTGPISVAKFMRQCLTSPTRGYYTASKEMPTMPAGPGVEQTGSVPDQFGRSGDFVTSPEISQVFGELVGIWLVAEWMLQGRASRGVRLIELGPGRGTLMDDILRTIKSFGQFAAAVESVHLVEASPTLREKQRHVLCGVSGGEEPVAARRLPHAKVVWHDRIEDIEIGGEDVPFVVAHEFFDALPIHVFRSLRQDPSSAGRTGGLTGGRSGQFGAIQGRTGGGGMERAEIGKLSWTELLVAPISEQSGSSNGAGISQKSGVDPDRAEFQLVPASGPTGQSSSLPQLSERFTRLRETAGATIEICPEGLVLASEIAALIGGRSRSALGRDLPRGSGGTRRVVKKPSGAALIIDYGTTESVPTNSLRGIRAHKLVSPFSQAGKVDLSVDVDFGGLAEAALRGSEEVEVHGPVEQSGWLRMMGGEERVDALARKAEAKPEKAGGASGPDIRKSWARLTDRGPTGMGRIYKAMAIVPRRDGKRPVGFGGDV